MSCSCCLADTARTTSNTNAGGLESLIPTGSSSRNAHSSSSSVSLRDMMRRAARAETLNNSNNAPVDQHGASFVQGEPIPTPTWPPESFDPLSLMPSEDEDSILGSSATQAQNKTMPSSGHFVVDPVERRSNALQILLLLLNKCAALEPHIVELLSAK